MDDINYATNVDVDVAGCDVVMLMINSGQAAIARHGVGIVPCGTVVAGVLVQHDVLETLQTSLPSTVGT